MKTKRLLSSEQALQAMRVFLSRYYDRTRGTAELGAVLGDLQINPEDGLPLDPAASDDWLIAVDSVLAKAE